MKQGQRETRRQVTGKIYIKPTGESAFIYLGHVLQIDEKHTEERTAIVEPDKGFLRETGSILNQFGWKYEAKLNERFNETLKLLHLATQGANVTQSAVTAPSGTASFEDVKQGRTYFLGKLNVNTVIVKVGDATKVLNADYQLDAGNGAITIIPGGGIEDDDDVDVTFGCGQVDTEVFSPLTEVRLTGDVRIDMFDQYSTVPVETHIFNGEYWISDRGQNTGKGIAEYLLQIIATDKPSIVTRH